MYLLRIKKSNKQELPKQETAKKNTNNNKQTTTTNYIWDYVMKKSQ